MLTQASPNCWRRSDLAGKSSPSPYLESGAGAGFVKHSLVLPAHRAGKWMAEHLPNATTDDPTAIYGDAEFGVFGQEDNRSVPTTSLPSIATRLVALRVIGIPPLATEPRPAPRSPA